MPYTRKFPFNLACVAVLLRCENAPMTMIESLLSTYDRNLDYAGRLVADLNDAAMVAQPASGMNHAAWVLGHLTSTCDVAMMGLGEPKVAPEGWRDRFGPRSQPLPDRAAYPNKEVLLDALREGHVQVSRAVRGLDAQRLLAPPAEARFRERWPALADMLLHVMISHEQMHLGQISAWRRVQGLPAV